MSTEKNTVKGNWGEVFRTAMEAQNISVYRLSKDTKIPTMTLHRYIKGSSEPPISRFNKIVERLKIEL